MVFGYAKSSGKGVTERSAAQSFIDALGCLWRTSFVGLYRMHLSGSLANYNKNREWVICLSKEINRGSMC